MARLKGFEPLRSLSLRGLLRSLIRSASLRSKNAQRFKVSGLESALATAKTMREDGIFVSAIRYPSVPENAARLRLTVMSSHTGPDLVRCAASLAKALMRS